MDMGEYLLYQITVDINEAQAVSCVDVIVDFGFK
jgi:hypothetical protein